VTTLKEIKAVHDGAHFLNVDLHIHSFGASADVKDTSLTPEAIVDSAYKQGISVIAITDHNSDRNVSAAIEYARKYDGELLVLAGTEVSTSNGHLLVYFAPNQLEALNNFLAKLELTGPRGGENTHTKLSMASVIAEATRLGGLCVAAHIDRPKTGFDTQSAGAQNWKRDIICSEGLYGIECDDYANLDYYSELDSSDAPGIERRNLFRARFSVSALAGRCDLARVQGSDAHTLEHFEPKEGDNKWTRMKLTELTWHGFCTAMTDPSARVRAKAQLPRHIPRIRGIAFTGGFLDKEVIHFSDNLNCFIGGRGTGKSTAIRSLAYCFGINEEFGNFDNCPLSIVLFCEDENGIPYRYTRTRNGSINVKAKEENAITDVPVDSFRIEYFGQGELAEVAKDPLKTPGLLQQFLDRHISLTDLEAIEKRLLNSLREVSARLIPLEQSFSQLGQHKENLKAIDAKLKIAEEGNLREVVSTRNKINSEKSLEKLLDDIITLYRNGVSHKSHERDFSALLNSVGVTTGNPRSNEILAEVGSVIEENNQMLRKVTRDINQTLNQSVLSLEKLSFELNANISALSEENAKAISELTDKGINVSLTEVDELLKQKALATREITTIEQRIPELEACRSERQHYLKLLFGTWLEMTARRKKQLKAINSNLMKTITDYSVNIMYEDSGVTDDFILFLRSHLLGTYFQEASLAQFCEAVTPQQLCSYVRDQNLEAIEAALSLPQDRVRLFMEKLSGWEVLFEMEVLRKPPKPIISVRTKSLPVRSIPIAHLSDGQRHTILLTIAMLAESNVPLVIDQPEDDLDNGFIATSIVTTLRTIKERRQVIVVTHNANIAVLGDAELILPMVREEDTGKIVSRGAIDSLATKNQVLSILEGGTTAFTKRQAVYGH
jgi:DNA repair ATPase RecN